jgi:uncharacterized RDD family membrane protein YckC
MKHRFPQLFSATVVALLVLVSDAPLRAQAAAPEPQDKAPAAAVAAPESPAPAELPAPAPTVVPLVPTPPPAPTPPVPPAPEWIERGEVVVFGNDVVIRENERASKVVAIGGDVDMRGCVDGELVAIGGDVKIDGPIGKLVAVGGDVELGPKASIDGEAVAVLGDLDNPHHVPIHGNTVEVGGFIPHPRIGAMLAWVGDAVGNVRLLSLHVRWPWYVFGTGVLFYLFLAAVFGRGVNACARVLEESPGTTLGTAVVLLPLLPLVALLLICTVIGIALLPFLAVAVLFAFVFGKVAVLAFLGRSVLRASGKGMVAERAWLTVLIGSVLLALLYCVPWVGLLVWALTSWIGFGMVVAAIRQNRQREQARVASKAVPVPAPTFVAAPPPVVAPAVPQTAAFAAAPEMAAVAGAAGEAPATPAPVPPVIPVTPPPALLTQLATLPRADFWPRLGALLIDIVLVAVAGGVTVVLSVFPFPLLFGGYVFGLWLWKGTTVGGIVFNLKVVRLDGRPIDAATAVVRTLVAFLSAVTLLGFLWCLWDSERQTWHDKVAGTVVVRVPKATPLV